jgi:hypothetical protein
VRALVVVSVSSGDKTGTVRDEPYNGQEGKKAPARERKKLEDRLRREAPRTEAERQASLTPVQQVLRRMGRTCSDWNECLIGPSTDCCDDPRRLGTDSAQRFR